MSFRKRLKFRFSKLIENVNLNKEQKSKLIELLILVGSILVALKPMPDFLIPIFMAFIFSSIFYYIFIQKDTLKSNIGDSILTAVIAFTFSGLANVNLFIALGKDLFSLTLATILFTLYYFLLGLMLWIALMKR